MKGATPDPSFQVLVQQFFTQRLVDQRAASRRTIESYRDAFRLLLQFAEGDLKRSPTALTMADLDAPFVLRFLAHLEKKRGNSSRTRNARLSAVRSFMRYAASRCPTTLPSIQRVLAIPTKRFNRPLLPFLDRKEVRALLASPDRSTWTGQRDYVLFATLYNTGARVSEVIGLTVGDVDLDRGCCVRVRGKGRKERSIPLWKRTATCLRGWVRQQPSATSPIFPNRAGQFLTRSGVEQRLRRAVIAAGKRCPSMVSKRISPHTFRHTTAMHLLQSGVDLSVIALWLGHENPATTHQYVQADLGMKEQALAKVAPLGAGRIRFKPGDRLLAFLEGL
jgi:integrase/recombinase XerD